MSDALLTIPDAAHHAGVTTRTVRRWIASNRLPAEHHHGRPHVDIADLNRVEAATRQHGGRARSWTNSAAMS